MLRNAESMFEWELSPGQEARAKYAMDLARHYLRAAEYGREASRLIRDGHYKKAVEAILKGRDIHPKSVEFAIEEFVSRVNPLARKAELMRDFDTSGVLYSLVVKIKC
ncbi:MAG: hypothetical protein U5L00_18900 [Desulfovermiculus sp.]|nr:hypothetical protein [Desulfovermiculus sp.]